MSFVIFLTLQSWLLSARGWIARGHAGLTRTLCRAVVVVVLLLPVTGSQAQTDKGALILHRLEEAATAISEGRLGSAESILNSILAGSPRDADAINLLGVVRAHQGRAGDAERLFRRAVAASSSHIGAHLNLGELLLTTNKPDQAMQVLLAAHKLAPAHVDINLKLATLYRVREKHEQALQHLQLIPRPAVDADYFPLLLDSLLKLNRLDESRQLALEFKESDIRNDVVQAQFATILAKGGLNDEAQDLLKIALLQSPRSLPVLHALGVVNAAAKRYEVAEEHLTEALRVAPDNVDTLRALARIARAAGNYEKALAHLVQARRLAANAPEVLFDFGVTALQMELLLDALPVFEQLHRLRPREPAYLYGLAAAHYKKGAPAEAVRLMKSYVILRPQDAAGFYLLGGALHNLNEFGEARAALERSLSLKSDPDVEFLLGITLQKLGNRLDAVKVLQRVVRARPDHAAAHAALGFEYREQGKDSEARAALELAVALDPNDLRACYQLGLVYSKLGDKDAAKRMFDRADDVRKQQRNRETVILKLIEPPQQ